MVCAACGNAPCGGLTSAKHALNGTAKVAQKLWLVATMGGFVTWNANMMHPEGPVE